MRQYSPLGTMGDSTEHMSHSGGKGAGVLHARLRAAPRGINSAALCLPHARSESLRTDPEVGSLKCMN